MNRKMLIKQMYHKNKLNFGFLLLATFIEIFASLFIAIMLEKVFAIAATENLEELKTQGIIFAILVAIFSLMYTLLLNIRPKYKKKAMMQYKNNIYNNILNKNISSFNKHETSTYISALTNDVNYIEENYIFNIFDLIGQIVLFIGALLVMLLYSPLLTAISIGLSLLPLIGTLLIGSKLSIHEKRISDDNGNFMHFVKDNLIGFSTIKVFKAEKKINDLFKQNNEKLEESKAKKVKTTVAMGFVGTITSVIAQFGVFFIGAYLSITTESMTPSIIIMFVQLMNNIMAPLMQIPDLISKRKACLPLFDKIANIINEESQKEDDKKTVNFNSSIKVNNLKFAYDDKVILNDLSVSFDKNKSYAIVGSSGSGKSTLLNLLLGRQLSYEGDINYDNNELKDISIDSLFEISSLVEQNVFVFDDSIINNITMYSEVDEELLNKAIKQSGLETLINQKGKDYKCGENGCNLSGGEKQRISIARALLKNSQLILMDEATSALDNETATMITNNVLDIENVTKIVVTHKLEENTLKRFDEIVVLKNGQVVEVGDFNTLLNNNGLFRYLYEIV